MAAGTCRATGRSTETSSTRRGRSRAECHRRRRRLRRRRRRASDSARGTGCSSCCALAAVVVSVVVHHVIYPALSWNRDEPVVPLAGRRRSATGAASRRPAGSPTFFHPVADRRHGTAQFFSQYTLGLAGRPARRRRAVRHRRRRRWCSGPLLTVLGTTCSPASSLATHGARSLAAPRDARVADRHHPERRVPRLPVHARARSAVRSRAARRASGAGAGGSLVVAGAAASAGCSSPARSTRCCGPSASVGTRSSPPGGSRTRQLARRRCSLALGFLPFLVATLVHNRTSPARSPSSRSPPRTRSTRSGSGCGGIMPTFGRPTTPSVQAVRSTGQAGGLLPLFLVGSYVLGAARRRRGCGCAGATARTWLLLG